MIYLKNNRIKWWNSLKSLTRELERAIFYFTLHYLYLPERETARFSQWWIVQRGYNSCRIVHQSTGRLDIKIMAWNHREHKRACVRRTMIFFFNLTLQRKKSRIRRYVPSFPAPRVWSCVGPVPMCRLGVSKLWRFQSKSCCGSCSHQQRSVLSKSHFVGASAFASWMKHQDVTLTLTYYLQMTHAIKLQ